MKKKLHRIMEPKHEQELKDMGHALRLLLAVENFFIEHGWHKQGGQESDRACIIVAMSRCMRNDGKSGMYEGIPFSAERLLRKLLCEDPVVAPFMNAPFQHGMIHFEPSTVQGLIRFNDHPSTKLEDVEGLIHRTKARLM